MWSKEVLSGMFDHVRIPVSHSSSTLAVSSTDAVLEESDMENNLFLALQPPVLFVKKGDI